MLAKVTVRLKPSVLDPQGEAIVKAAGSLGFDGVKNVRVGKVFDLDLSEDISEQEAQDLCVQLGKKLLANPVIENFDVSFHKGSKA